MQRPLVSPARISLMYSTWWILWIAVQAWVMIDSGFDYGIAFRDASITQFIFALAGYSIHTSMRSYQPSVKNSVYVFTWGIGISIASAYLQKWTNLQWIPNVNGYHEYLANSIIVRAAFGSLMMMIIAILTWFYVYASERKEIESRKEDAARLTREAELSRLRQQLQPHFLFNSLNSISALAGSKPEEARKMIQQLSDFLRGTVKRDDSILVTLNEEIEHLQLYLEIEKVRFGHRLNTIIQKSDESLSLKLPSLLLQPLVENAIKFGLYDTVGEITISLASKNENNMLVIEIKNPFDPATAAPQRGTGFGLSSVQRRLYLLYLRNDLIVTTQDENVFTTTVKIPQTL